MYIILGLLSAVFASLVAILGKLGLKQLDSTVATTVRSLIMALFLLVLSLVIGKWQTINWSMMSARDWWLIIGSGLAGALSWLAYFSALQLGPATQVAALDRLSLVFVAILALLFLGETLSWYRGVGILLMVLGIYLLTWK